ncbi:MULTISPECIES: hypothetical protein [unclassified Streptomyces]|uniref:hypothetical protein n=1 Tax=unclassified Streptomyces TaxID=2593676 RepID=UPI0006FD8489|nr:MULTISPECIES: hypothetical protein [unclassified Streptomyces]KQX47502.1 hypothetical protein ASD33_22255 [Streptomyces sp. Root1304]KRA94810.1 hypothetical protein ASE09_31480 [Streptomyces sp. Root66D1]
MTTADENRGHRDDHLSLDGLSLALGDGTRVTRVAKPLGTGGQGSVWRLNERADLAAKIYNRTPDGAQLRRLTAMLRADPLAGERLAPGQPPMLVWPVDTIEAGGSPIGYGMPYLDPAAHTQLSGLLQKPVRLRRFEGRAHWKFLLAVASNLAYMTAELHQQGFVVGDLSSANAVVDRNGFVTFLDCDSFAFTDALTGESFGCEVFTDDYASPERQRGEPPTRHADDFALAVLVYQLITGGNHPFDGAPLYGAAEATRKDNIMSGTSFLVEPDRVRVPAQLLPPEVLPPRLVELARRTFGPGIRDPRRRPSSAVWLDALDDARESVVQCADAADHHYAGHLTACPWCGRRSAGQPDPFVAGPGRSTGAGAPAGASAGTKDSVFVPLGSVPRPAAPSGSGAPAGPGTPSGASARPGASGTPRTSGTSRTSGPSAGPSTSAPPGGTAPPGGGSKASVPPPRTATPQTGSNPPGPVPQGVEPAAVPETKPLTKGEIALGCAALLILGGIVAALIWGVYALVQTIWP